MLLTPRNNLIAEVAAAAPGAVGQIERQILREELDNIRRLEVSTTTGQVLGSIAIIDCIPPVETSETSSKFIVTEEELSRSSGGIMFGFAALKIPEV